MQIKIYESIKDKTKFLVVPKNTDLSKINLSSTDAELYQQVSLFKELSIEIDDKPRIGIINSNSLISKINSNGYATLE